MFRGNGNLRINEAINLLEQNVKQKEMELKELKDSESLSNFVNKVIYTLNTATRSSHMLGNIFRNAKQGGQIVYAKCCEKMKENSYMFLAQVAGYSFAAGFLMGMFRPVKRLRNK